MNREIKFRFIKDNNIMGYRSLIAPSGIIDMPWEWDTADQYTGLKDKNGVEIYEGDIYKLSQSGFYWIHQVKSLGGQFGNNLYAVLVEHNVSSVDDRFTYERTKVSGINRSYVHSGKDVEIIGNVHDNPELLEVTA